jgi:hypothetical protein
MSVTPAREPDVSVSTSQYVARGKVRVIVYYKPKKVLGVKAQELQLVFDILEEATRNQKPFTEFNQKIPENSTLCYTRRTW